MPPYGAIHKHDDPAVITQLGVRMEHRLFFFPFGFRSDPFDNRCVSMNSCAAIFYHQEFPSIILSVVIVLLAWFGARKLMRRNHWGESAASATPTLPFVNRWNRLPDRVRYFAGMGIFVVTYYLAVKGGRALTFPLSAPLWFPDSVLLCAFLLTPARHWWMFLLVALPIRLFAFGREDALLWTVSATYVNDGLKAILAAVLLRRFVPDLTRLSRLREFTIFLLITVVTVPALSALAGAAEHVYLGESYWIAWGQWFLGNSLVNLVVTTAVLYWLFDDYKELRTPSPWHDFEAGLLCVGFVLIAVKAFGHLNGSSPAIIYAPVPFLLWAAVRFGPCGAATALSVLAFIAIRAAAEGHGPFSTHSSAQNVLTIQLFLFVIGGPILFLASLLRERQRAERALQRSEDRYRTLVENFPGGNMSVFDNDLRLRFLGGEDVKDHGPSEMFVGKLLAELAPPETCAIVEPNLRLAFQGRKVTYETSFRGGTKYRATATPLYSEDGSISEVMVVAANITEQERAEEALQESEERFRMLAEVTNDAIWDWDLVTNELWWNEGFETLFGYSRDEIEKTIDSWYNRIHPADRGRVVSGIHRVIDQGGTTWSDEYRFLCKNGSYAYVLDRGHVIRNATDKAVRMVGGMRDLTERNLAEAAVQALPRELLRAQDEERRRIARELHDSTAQELAVVSMNLGRLEEWLEGKDPWAENLLADSLAVLSQGNRDLRTLAHLLHPPMLEELGLLGALQDYVEGFSARSGIQVKLESTEDFERCSPEIETALFRVVQESLSNVHRHSDSKVASIKLERDGNLIRLTIADLGKGLPSGLLTGTADKARVGVGISGMRQRIDQLQGRLEISSDAQGTTVCAVLPSNREQGHTNNSFGQ